MFTMTVFTKNNSFLEFLYNESTHISSNDLQHVFSFSSIEKASEIISTYILYSIKEKNIDQMIKNRLLTETEKNDFSKFVSNEKIFSMLDTIKNKLLTFFNDNDSLHFEGFISFRFKDENEEIKKILQSFYDEFCDINYHSENFLSLKSILEQQAPLEDDLVMAIEKNKQVTLEGKNKVYFEDVIENEDTVLSHTILISPKQLRVYDPHHFLTKEAVILLKQLFNEKVNFYYETYNKN